ncbi:MAG TPA: hypothetical protein VNJ12_10770, partial [Candidatus Dormibacteraeota bacterium]|nr:hypothetical protein [Candidatus Dormibacteraeota bacterium]
TTSARPGPRSVALYVVPNPADAPWNEAPDIESQFTSYVESFHPVKHRRTAQPLRRGFHG